MMSSPFSCACDADALHLSFHTILFEPGCTPSYDGLPRNIKHIFSHPKTPPIFHNILLYSQVMGSLVKGIREQAIWLLSRLLEDRPHAGVPDKRTDRSDQHKADQRNSDPGSLEATGGERHVKSGETNEQHAPHHERRDDDDQPRDGTHLLDMTRSEHRGKAAQPDAETHTGAHGPTHMQEKCHRGEAHASVLLLLTLFFKTNGARGAIDRNATSGGNALRCLRYADDRRDAILASHNGPVCHRASHFHHQSRCLQEEWRPAGVSRGSDQDIAGGEARVVGIEDDPRRSRHDPRGCRCSLERTGCQDGALRLSRRFCSIRKQHEWDMTTREFPRKGGMPLPHALSQIRSGKRLMHFGKRQEEDICCLSQSAHPGKFLSDGHKMRPRLGEQERPDESGHLTETSERVGASQAPASQAPA